MISRSRSFVGDFHTPSMQLNDYHIYSKSLSFQLFAKQPETRSSLLTRSGTGGVELISNAGKYVNGKQGRSLLDQVLSS